MFVISILSNMYIVSGTASKTVAEGLSRELKAPLAEMIAKRFPDNEMYIRIIDDVAGEEVYLR